MGALTALVASLGTHAVRSGRLAAAWPAAGTPRQRHAQPRSTSMHAQPPGLAAHVTSAHACSAQSIPTSVPLPSACCAGHGTRPATAVRTSAHGLPRAHATGARHDDAWASHGSHARPHGARRHGPRGYGPRGYGPDGLHGRATRGSYDAAPWGRTFPHARAGA